MAIAWAIGIGLFLFLLLVFPRRTMGLTVLCGVALGGFLLWTKMKNDERDRKRAAIAPTPTGSLGLDRDKHKPDLPQEIVVSEKRSFDGPVFSCPEIWLDNEMTDEMIDGWINGQTLRSFIPQSDMRASQRSINRWPHRSMRSRPPVAGRYLKIAYLVPKRTGQD